MNDKILVLIFILAGIVCIGAVFQYIQKQQQKYFNVAAIAGAIAGVCFIWVYYGLGQ